MIDHVRLSDTPTLTNDREKKVTFELSEVFQNGSDHLFCTCAVKSVGNCVEDAPSIIYTCGGDTFCGARACLCDACETEATGSDLHLVTCTMFPVNLMCFQSFLTWRNQLITSHVIVRDVDLSGADQIPVDSLFLSSAKQLQTNTDGSACSVEPSKHRRYWTDKPGGSYRCCPCSPITCLESC